jgi:hypothetical protein
MIVGGNRTNTQTGKVLPSHVATDEDGWAVYAREGSQQHDSAATQDLTARASRSSTADLTHDVMPADVMHDVSRPGDISEIERDFSQDRMHQRWVINIFLRSIIIIDIIY